MTDEPTTKSGLRPKGSGTNNGHSLSGNTQASAPPSISTISAPARRDVGQKNEKASKNTNPSKTHEHSSKSNRPHTEEQVAEGETAEVKGARAGPEKVSTDDSPPDDHWDQEEVEGSGPRTMAESEKQGDKDKSADTDPEDTASGHAL
jgi:hypothetical protein